MTELLMGLNGNVHDRLRNRNRLFKFSDVLHPNCNVLVAVEEVCSHVPKSEKAEYRSKSFRMYPARPKRKLSGALWT